MNIVGEKRIILEANFRDGSTKTALVTADAYLDTNFEPLSFFVGAVSAKSVGEVTISGNIEIGSCLDEAYVSS